MKIKDLLIRFLVTFGVVLMANILITLCWNYFIKHTGPVVDWETSFRMAILFAIVIPLTMYRNK